MKEFVSKAAESLYLLKRAILYPYGGLLYNRVKAKQRYANAASNRIIIPDHSRFVDAEHHFNPTIEFIDNRWLMVYRIITSENKRQLVICQLDDNLQPKPETNVNLSQFIVDFPNAQRWHSDPRFFRHSDKLFINYNDRNLDDDRIRLFLLEICSKTLKPKGVARKLEIASNSALKTQRVEKNWQLFSYKQHLYSVYKINPHVILRLKNFSEDTNVIDCEPIYETGTPDRFFTKLKLLTGRLKWGEPRGGTSPVLIGDTYFSFFHTAMYHSGIYCFGLYGFHAEPPFRIKYLSKEPIIFPELQKAYTSELNRGWAVVYPCGAVFDEKESHWYVSYGVMDKELRIVVLDHDQLLRNCFVL